MRPDSGNRLINVFLTLIAMAMTLILSGCTHVKPLLNPMPQQYYIAGSQRAETLLVLLPGIYDEMTMFETQGFVESVHQAGLPCDMVSVDAHYGYYKAGTFIARLHSDVIVQAMAAGYTNISIVGISLGGYGALLYANSYPADVTSIVLLAPWLGDDEIINSIVQDGGLQAWEVDTPIDQEKIQKIWLQRKESMSMADNPYEIYLGYGQNDRFHKAHRLFAATVPDDHVFALPGSHNWTTWLNLWKKIQAEKILCSG